MTSRYDLLFEPVKIGPVTAPNRFFAAPHATGHGWNQPSGAIALRGMKAEGGWGTVVTQITEVSPDSDLASHPMERIWDDSDIPRHAAQVEAVKAHGSLAGIELGHGGMRSRNFTSGLPVLGPSALPILRPDVPLHSMAMGLGDIREFRRAHKAAAKRAKQAGYDILYVYAAHDISLLCNFLSINVNHRTDEYGGSFENRLRLIREVLEDTAEVAAGDCAVAFRFGVAEPGKVNGLRHDGEGRDVVEALADVPDLWDVNISGWSNDSATARFSEEGHQLPFTDFVKTVTNKPVVGVGRFTSPDMMVSMVKKGQLDLIGAARPSIADPFLPNKIRDDRIEDIRECIGCNICVSMDSYGVPVRCTQNPTISEEWRRGWHPEAPAISKGQKSHLIIGSGPAGLECAVTLLRAGQVVTVAEALDVAGGRVTREGALPGLMSWTRVRDYRMGQLLQSGDADVYLSSPLTVGDVGEFGADSVTLATGSVWRADGLGSTCYTPWADDGLLTPDDVMNGATKGAARRFAIYDDDHFYMASVLAEELVKQGHHVSYVTPLPAVSSWTENTLDQGKIIARLASLGIPMFVNATLSDAGFCDTLSGAMIDVAQDEIVFVGARKPLDDLGQALKQQGDIAPLFHAGDCVSPGTIQAAVLSGHTVAREILRDGAPEKPFKRDQVLIATP